jgi:hypothetical protein
MTAEQPKGINLEVGDPITVHQDQTAADFEVAEVHPAEVIVQIGKLVLTRQSFTLQPTEEQQL